MQADIAQLVERNLAKVEVASSSLVVRSEGLPRTFLEPPRWVGREARQRTANPSTRVQIPYPPLPLDSSQFKTWAIGAAVARFLDTEEVTGSNPVSPTREHAGQRPVSTWKPASRATYVQQATTSGGLHLYQGSRSPHLLTADAAKIRRVRLPRQRANLPVPVLDELQSPHEGTSA